MKTGPVSIHWRSGPFRSITTRQYAKLLSDWIASIELDPKLFGTQSLRRTKGDLELSAHRYAVLAPGERRDAYDVAPRWRCRGQPSLHFRQIFKTQKSLERVPESTTGKLQ
jgi:hypothetical protein